MPPRRAHAPASGHLAGRSNRPQWYGCPTRRSQQGLLAARSLTSRTRRGAVRWTAVRSMAPSALRSCPDGVISRPTRAREDSAVQTIASPRRPRLPIAAVLVGTLVGLALFGGGLFLGWLALGAPLVTTLAPATIRPSLSQLVLGGIVVGGAPVLPGPVPHCSLLPLLLAVGPHGEPRRALVARCRARPSLVRFGRPGLRAEGVRGARHDRSDHRPDADVCGRRARAGAGVARFAAAVAGAQRRSPGPDRGADHGPAVSRPPARPLMPRRRWQGV